MITGKTKSGFEFSYDKRILTDWRFITAISDSQSKDDSKKISGVTNMVELLLGADGMESLSAHIASVNDGYVPIEAVMEEIKEILNNSKETKN